MLRRHTMGPTIPITRSITIGLIDGQSTARHLAAQLLLIALTVVALAAT